MFQCYATFQNSTMIFEQNVYLFLCAEFDWSDTDDMSQYEPFGIYDRYLKDRGILGGLRNLLS